MSKPFSELSGRFQSVRQAIWIILGQGQYHLAVAGGCAAGNSSRDKSDEEHT